jgi:hypothetical protein
VLKIVAAVGTAAFGALALYLEPKREEGKLKLTKGGWIALIGIVVSLLANFTIEMVQAKKDLNDSLEAGRQYRCLAATTTATLTAMSRSMQSLAKPQVDLELEVPANDPQWASLYDAAGGNDATLTHPVRQIRHGIVWPAAADVKRAAVRVSLIRTGKTLSITGSNIDNADLILASPYDGGLDVTTERRCDGPKCRVFLDLQGPLHIDQTRNRIDSLTDFAGEDIYFRTSNRELNKLNVAFATVMVENGHHKTVTPAAAGLKIPFWKFSNAATTSVSPSEYCNESK